MGDVQGEATEEDGEHECPFEVLEDGTEERSFADSVAHYCQSDVAETVEDDDDAEPDFPGVDVVFVEVAVEPADGEVVGCCHYPGGAYGIVCTLHTQCGQRCGLRLLEDTLGWLYEYGGRNLLYRK